jgi:hypothetical protein
MGIQTFIAQYIEHGVGNISPVATSQRTMLAKKASQHRISRRVEGQRFGKYAPQQVGYSLRGRPIAARPVLA